MKTGKKILLRARTGGIYIMLSSHCHVLLWPIGQLIVVIFLLGMLEEYYFSTSGDSSTIEYSEHVRTALTRLF